jgi:hypothetical protein
LGLKRDKIWWCKACGRRGYLPHGSQEVMRQRKEESRDKITLFRGTPHDILPPTRPQFLIARSAMKSTMD